MGKPGRPKGWRQELPSGVLLNDRHDWPREDSRDWLKSVGL